MTGPGPGVLAAQEADAGRLPRAQQYAHNPLPPPRPSSILMVIPGWNEGCGDVPGGGGAGSGVHDSWTGSLAVCPQTVPSWVPAPGKTLEGGSHCHRSSAIPAEAQTLGGPWMWGAHTDCRHRKPFQPRGHWADAHGARQGVPHGVGRAGPQLGPSSSAPGSTPCSRPQGPEEVPPGYSERAVVRGRSGRGAGRQSRRGASPACPPYCPGFLGVWRLQGSDLLASGLRQSRGLCPALHTSQLMGGPPRTPGWAMVL